MSPFCGCDDFLALLSLAARGDGQRLPFDGALNQREDLLSLLRLKREGSRTRVTASAGFDS